MRLRASSIAPLFLGESGLTSKQSETLAQLLEKIKLTDKQAQTRDELIAKRDAPYELSQGAKTLIEEVIDQEVYGYKVNFSTKETMKGTVVEDDSIDLYNRIHFTSYEKSDMELKYDIMSGHPDIVDEVNLRVIDIKSPWSKKTFPKRPESNTLYEWQIKSYLFMLRESTGKDYRKGEVAYMLVNTPEDLIPQNDDDSLHFMDHLSDNLRCTRVMYELNDDDIAKIKERLKLAKEYGESYLKELMSK